MIYSNNKPSYVSKYIRKTFVYHFQLSHFVKHPRFFTMDTDEGQQNNLITEFRSIADVDEQRARFYLESANWELQVPTFIFWSLFFSFISGGSPTLYLDGVESIGKV